MALSYKSFRTLSDVYQRTTFLPSKMGSRNILALYMLCFAVAKAKKGTEPPKPIIKSLHINSDIKYTYAKTFVSSRILNPAEVAQEVNFRVVLPEEAFITGLVMTIKGKSYNAYIKDKEEAKKQYNKAVSSGQGAAHVFQESRFSKDFTVSVNVEPQEKVNFNLTYEELLSRKNRTYQNTINVNPHQIVDNLTIVVNIEDALEIINVDVDEFSLSNNLAKSDRASFSANITRIGPNKVHVEWKPSTEDQIKLNREGLNGQMIVKYDVNASTTPQQILMDNDGYFVHILRNDTLPVLKKHVVFVLDVSGSMEGTKIAQLKDAMKKILSDLSESDQFSIVLFSTNVVAWGPKEGVNLDGLSRGTVERANVVKDDNVIPASRSNIESALRFMDKVSCYAMTNILGGLRLGLKLAKKGQELNATSAQPMESMIIFLTDGQPNTEESIPDKIIEKVKILNNGVTIFTLGFGSDADMKFLKKLSLENHGFARRVYEDSDASIQLQNFYKEVASPVLSDIKFEYLPDQVENVTSKVFKNLFLGSEVIVSGKVKPNGKVAGVVVAKSWAGDVRFQIPIDDKVILPKEENRTLGHLEKMWAYKTIKSLLDKNTVSKNESIESKAKELALKYSFVTPLTSLIVVKPNNSAEITDEESSGRRREPNFGRMNRRMRDGKELYQPPDTAARRQGAYGTDLRIPTDSESTELSVPHGPYALVAARSHLAAMSFLQIEPSFILSETTNAKTLPQYTGVPYQKVTWLNQTASEDGYLIPPSSLQTTDVIALNETNVISTKCANGKSCRHFIFCALAEFADDVSKFLPFKCHIETKFVGVCCPF